MLSFRSFGQTEQEMKSKIAANFDTVRIAVNSKVLNPPRKQPPKTRYHTIVIRDTVYVDTCINHVVDNYIFARLPDTIKTVKPITPPEKKSWFYRLFHKRRKKPLENF